MVLNTILFSMTYADQPDIYTTTLENMNTGEASPERTPPALLTSPLH